MKIAIGNDHAAAELKFIIMDYVKSLGHEVVNFGTDGNESCNYPDLREMCFGSFEGRHYIHIEHDPDYLAWLEANKTAARPDGERIQDFCNRSCAAFAKLVEESLAQHKQQLVIVAHGGIQMAVMSRYGLPRRDYHDWCGPNAGGYRLDAANWQTDHTLQLLETVQYTKATQSEAAL